MVKHSKITKVFQLSLVIIFILVLLGLFVPQQFQNISFYLRNLLTTSVGWFYLLLVTGILIFWGTIYQFTLDTIYSAYENIKKGDFQAEIVF